MAKNIGTLGKYDQRRLWKLICMVNPFYILFLQFTKSNLSLDNKNLKLGEISLWNKKKISNTLYTIICTPVNSYEKNISEVYSH